MGDRARRLQLQRRRLELLHGRLTNDRADELKLDASYEFPQRPLSGLNVAVSVHWFSGIPLTAYGFSFAGGSPEYFLTPRGALGTGPSDWEADVHADYGWTLNGERRVHLVANIFNVFNRQGITQLDERYNLAQNGPCAGIPDGACNGDGGLATTPGTLTPLIELAAPRSTATNPDFLRAGMNFTAPRSLQIGVRVTF